MFNAGAGSNGMNPDAQTPIEPGKMDDSLQRTTHTANLQ